MKKIEVKQVSYCYQNMCVIEETDFSVNQGDFTAIIGVNGSGKSTLMRLLAGLMQPQTGSVTLFDNDGQVLKNTAKIAYVAQNAGNLHSSFPATSMEIVLAECIGEIGWFKRPGKQHREMAMNALKQVGMEKYANTQISEMSGGQQQRIMLAKALMNQPELLLLDEPTSALDNAFSRKFYEILKDLNVNQGITIVLITHDLAMARDYVDRIFCLEEATLIELDKDQVEEELRHRHVHRHLQGDN